MNESMLEENVRTAFLGTAIDFVTTFIPVGSLAVTNLIAFAETTIEIAKIFEKYAMYLDKEEEEENGSDS